MCYWVTLLTEWMARGLQSIIITVQIVPRGVKGKDHLCSQLRFSFSKIYSAHSKWESICCIQGSAPQMKTFNWRLKRGARGWEEEELEKKVYERVEMHVAGRARDLTLKNHFNTKTFSEMMEQVRGRKLRNSPQYLSLAGLPHRFSSWRKHSARQEILCLKLHSWDSLIKKINVSDQFFLNKFIIF